MTATILVIVITTLTAFAHLYREAETRTAIVAKNLAKTLDLSIEGLIDRIDIALLASTDEIERQLSTGHVDLQSVTTRLQQQAARLPEVSYIRGTDEHGDVVYGPGALTPATQNADRDYFIRLRDDPRLDLFINKPIISRFNHQWVWVFARRIKKPDGSFGGTVFCTILLEQVEGMFSRVELGSDDSIALRDADLGLIARYPPAATINIAPGDNKPLSIPFTDTLKSHPQAGTYISGDTSIDGISRLHAYIRNTKYGFIINVGVGGKAIQTELRKQEWVITSFAITLIAALLIFSKVINRAWLRQEKNLALLHEAQKLANFGNYVYNLRADRWKSSISLDHIFGIDREYPRDMQHWLDLIVAESRQEMQTYLNTVVEQRLPFDREYRIIRPRDKQARWIHGQGTLHLDKRGKPLTLVGTIQDITAHKLMELALVDSEARYRAIIESSPVPIALNDERGNITYLNKAFIQIVGYTNDEIPTLEDWWPRAYPNPLYRQWVIENWQNTLEEAKRGNIPFIPIELDIRCKDEAIRTFMASASPLQENFAGTHLVTLFDITERKLAEREQRIAAIAFEAQEGMVITDADNNILRVNKAYTEITGYSPEEVIGKNPRITQSGRHNAGFYAAMWRSLDSAGKWAGEIWNQRKSGDFYPEYMTITVVKDQAGIVTNYVATFTDTTPIKSAEDEIERLAFFDPLTGLPNRRLLQDRLRSALNASHRSGQKGAMLFIDLDNFKMLNESLGHDKGDMLLQQVAQRIESCVREGDTVARFGGDEFVVILSGLSEKTLEAVGQTEAFGNTILHALNQPYQLDKQEYGNSSSIGATLFHGNDQDIDELLKQGDIAMYQAKSSGRNIIRFFDPQMQASITARMALDTDLRQGLANSQFTLYYQPQIHQTGRIIGAEVLIRWRHPLRGLISPVDFIPLAEDSGLILPIGQWVLETACAQLKSWESDPLARHLQLAVNVSALQFRQADFVEQVCLILRRSAINPDRLKLELTETMVLDDMNGTILKMQALRKTGVRFSMDDFGTGYSSLSSLKKLPIDQLKIDQSFVHDISIDPDDTVIVQTIIAMANNLGMEVIAEGVETEAQRVFLEQHGCPIYQGYLFGKPTPLAEFEELLTRMNAV